MGSFGLSKRKSGNRGRRETKGSPLQSRSLFSQSSLIDARPLFTSHPVRRVYVCQVSSQLGEGDSNSADSDKRMKDGWCGRMRFTRKRIRSRSSCRGAARAGLHGAETCRDVGSEEPGAVCIRMWALQRTHGAAWRSRGISNVCTTFRSGWMGRLGCQCESPCFLESGLSSMQNADWG